MAAKADSTEDCHVLTFPLRVNAREASILGQRLRAANKLWNATLGELKQRGLGMKRDPRWVDAMQIKSKSERKRVYRQLREAYDLDISGLDAGHLALKHWRNSKWMPKVIDTYITQAAGREVWNGVKAWLYNHQGIPGYRKSNELEWTVWSGDNRPSGLCYKDNCVYWRQAGSKKRKRRKDICLNLMLDKKSEQYRKRIQNRIITSIGIKCEAVRGKEKWFVMLRIKGQPYRDPEYLAMVESLGDQSFAVDVNCREFAVVGEVKQGIEGQSMSIEPDYEAKAIRKQKGRERALDRSRRAANPDCYDGNGQAIAGKHPNQLSIRGRRLQTAIMEQQRKQRILRRQQGNAEAKRLISTYGKILIREELNYSTWVRGDLALGKITQQTSPGTRMRILESEIRRAGGQIISINPYQAALSQTCLCGHKTGKENYHYHVCEECGLGKDMPLDRDLFSAYLAYLHGKLILEGKYHLLKKNKALLNSTGNRRKAAEICCSPVAITKPDGSSTSQRTNAETWDQSARANPKASTHSQPALEF